MNVCSWSAFFMRGAGLNGAGLNGGGLHGAAKVLLHFFPVANGVTAPYPVHAVLEVFANGKLLERQGFEGLRINQPDGLDLADVFPSLFRQAGPAAAQVSGSPLGGAPSRTTRVDAFEQQPKTQPSTTISNIDARELGLTIQLGTNQPRIDLSRSKVIVEVCYPSHRLRYHAVQAGQERGSRTREFSLSDEAPVFAHEGYESRLIEINPEPAEADMRLVSGLQSGSNEGDSKEVSSHAASGELGGYCLRSMRIDASHLPAASGRVSVGDGFQPAGRIPKARNEDDEVDGAGEEEDSVVRFLVQYERTSTLPVSVRCV